MPAAVSVPHDRGVTVNTAGVRSGAGRPATGFPYLDAVLDQSGSVVAMAHRGGAGRPGLAGLENTLEAFRDAVDLGYHYLETDLHATVDGTLVAFHDESLDRVTDRTGRIAELTGAQVAGARIRGGHGIPLMADLLEEFPGVRFNVDLKSFAAVEPFAALVDRTGAHDRLCVGSFSRRSIELFRRRSGGRVATSAAPSEVVAFLALPSAHAARRLTGGRVAALQVPHRRGPLPVVTATLVHRAHRAGAHVHVWTVDDPDEMHALLDLGVDGLITDRTDLLKDVLVARGQWRDHP